jgi:hypothetical protein
VLLTTLLSRLTVLPLESDAEPDGELRQKAKELLDELTAGNELNALAMLSAYERDRTGLAAFLAAVKAEAANRLTASAKTGQIIRSEQEKLLRLIGNAEKLEAALAMNVSGLLLVTSLFI